MGDGKDCQGSEFPSLALMSSGNAVRNILICESWTFCVGFSSDADMVLFLRGKVLVGGAALSAVRETPSHRVHRRPSPVQLGYPSRRRPVQTQTLHQAHASSAVLHCEFLNPVKVL